MGKSLTFAEICKVTCRSERQVYFYTLFSHNLSLLDHTASNDELINDQSLARIVDGSGSSLTEGTVATFPWKNWRKSTPVSIAGH
jgi:hypothetical protein